MARRRKSKPTKGGVGGRGEKQRVRDRLSHATDDARRLGLPEIKRIEDGPLPPEESLKPERVDPSSQDSRRYPGLIGRAIRKGWATPDEKKPGLVDELIATVEDKSASAMAKIFAFNALVKGDQVQRECDQEYVRLDRVLAMWQGVIEALRNHVQDQGVLKAVVDEVLLLLPIPAHVGRGVIEGEVEKVAEGNRVC